MDATEQRYREYQYITFKNYWETKWSKFFDDDNLKNSILDLKYDKFYHVNNAFGKLDKTLQICDFLSQLSEQQPPQDTEKIKITILVSCAEAVYRVNKPREIISENLAKGFFKPVNNKLQYKIRAHAGEIPYKKLFTPAEVLYLIRNDYIHNGNFTGTFFKAASSNAVKLGNFYYSEKENKTKLILVNSECHLTYQEFLQIFLEAFIKNIEKYCNKK